MPAEVIDESMQKYGKLVLRRASEYSQTPQYAMSEMLSTPSFMTTVGDNGVVVPISILPGLHLGSIAKDGTGGITGPSPKRIMMIGCWPNSVEDKNGRLFHGDWVQEFKQICDKTSFPASDVYYTTYVKQYVDGKKTSIPKELVADYQPLFLRELEEVKPDLVIILGSKVLKAVMGSKATMEQYKNRTLSAEESPLGVKTAAIVDFSAIIHMPEMRAAITLDMTRIVNELVNKTPVVKDDVVTSYSCVYSLDKLKEGLDIISSQYSGWLSVDCEWGGRNHLDGDLRCIQFSWAPGKALVAVFHTMDMTPTALQTQKTEAWALIKALVEDKRTKLIGHFIRADLPWLSFNGINVSSAALNGWDTALAGHLLNENWGQGLEIYTARHTQMGRYELPLSNWIKENRYDIDALGYGGIPDDILLPYAAQDADATFRIFLMQFEEMNKAENRKILDLFRYLVMPATMPILEIEMTGMNVDHARLELLSQKYTDKRRQLTQKLQDLLNWPEFNPDSPAQKAAALFGWVKKGSKSGPPEGVKLRKFEPVKATNDKKWSEVIQNSAKMDSYTPSTDRSVLTSLLLVHKDDELLNTMLLYTAVSQTVKTFTGEFVETVDDNGLCTHSIDGGIMPKLWKDGRVHTRIRQTIETGRYGHSDPNMAQLPKTAEDLVGKAFKQDSGSLPSIRSCFRADPGWVLLDCDWVQAELFVMAWLSGDANMQRKLSDPGSDFHSEVAIEMFRLDPPPADYAKGKKEWLKETGNSKYRTIAKTITFGIAYGRGAAAIKEAVYMEGVNITIDEAQASVDKFKETFPKLAYWLEEQQSKVETQGYVENGFGRRRRFEKTEDWEQVGHQKRQAMNAPIQGTVGDLMSLALVNLYMIREVERPHLQYRVVMSVHDQVIVTCPVDQLDETMEVMRLAMCERCRIPGNDLLLGIDPEVCIRWSEPLTAEDVASYPSLTKYAKLDK